MKKFTAALLAAFMLFAAGCSDSDFIRKIPKDTEETKKPVETSYTTTTPEEITTPATTVTEATEPVITTPAVTVPPLDSEPVTDKVDSPSTPVDYSSLADRYGYDFDRDPARTWAEISGTSTVDPSKPMIALTFDDGPGVHTERLLEILKNNNAKATFFVAGYMLENRKDTLKAIAAGGHDIGGHSWSHNDLTKLSEQAVVDEIMLTRQMIYSVTGVDTRLVRPPYGANNDYTRGIAANLGVVFINWNIDTEDWRYRNADTVYDSTVGNARDGAIILCHDIHKTTVDAMERVVPKLIEDGYQLVTVSELMAHSDRAFEAGKLFSQQ